MQLPFPIKVYLKRGGEEGTTYVPAQSYYTYLFGGTLLHTNTTAPSLLLSPSLCELLVRLWRGMGGDTYLPLLSLVTGGDRKGDGVVG